MRFLIKAIVSVALLTAVAAAIAWFVSPVRPAPWTPDPVAPLEGAYAQNDRLSTARVLDLGTGPEDVELGPDGRFYTGLLDGRILSFTRAGDVRRFADTGGRPLGIAFAGDGRLIVADADRGLLAVDAAANIEVLVEADDTLRFTDDLDIDREGVVWFTNASQRYGVHDYMGDFLEASRTGQLMRHDLASGETRVVADDLFFANGIALGPDDDYLLVTETGMGRIHRFWIRGPRAGTRDVFAEHLPGHPDNLSFNGRDTFWVAMPVLRGGPLEGLAGLPWLRRLLGALPQSMLVPPDRYALVVGFSPDGQPVRSLHLEGGELHSITSANEFEGVLYLGTIADDHVGIYALDD